MKTMRATYHKFLFKICAGIAALCAAGFAHADSSVTLYGIADVGLMYLSHSTPGLNGTADSTAHQISLTNAGYAPSLWGIKGTEDLGGGLKANFNLESGINLTNGGYDNPGSNNGLFNRIADVGLSGNFGTLTAGLQFSPFFNMVYELDPRGAAEFGSILTPVVDDNLIATLFMPNAVSYTSPNISGFQVSGLFGLGGVAGSFRTGRSWSLSAQYANGPLLIGAGYINVNNAADNGLAAIGGLYPINARSWTAGASYRFGTLTVKAAFTNFKENSVPVSVDPSLAFSTDSSINVYSGGIDYLVLPTLDVNAGIYYQQDRVHSGDRSITGAAGAQYFLSKRTALYAQVAVVNNRCSGDGTCMGSGISVENNGSALGGLYGLGTAAAGLGLPSGTTVGANVGIRTMF